MNKQVYCGCDVGSTYGKAVIIDDDKEILGSSIVRSGLDPEQTAVEAIREAMEASNGIVSSIDDFAYIIGTGYGRNLVPFANENISEISCHAMGVHVVDPTIRTIVDFGGQDLKGISLDEDGMVNNFQMNDKCAAGTGRFFEAMARVFNMNIQDFSDLSLEATEEIPITSQCSVFAETEVISMIAKKKKPADIALGIQSSVARRCYALLRGTGIKPNVTITGGCAKNKGLIKSLEKLFKLKLIELPVDAQLMGAIGAAEYARLRSIKAGGKNGKEIA